MVVQLAHLQLQLQDFFLHLLLDYQHPRTKHSDEGQNKQEHNKRPHCVLLLVERGTEDNHQAGTDRSLLLPASFLLKHTYDPPQMNNNNNSAFFKASEIHFLSQDELIRIVPSFSGDTLHLISGDYGPFVHLTPIEVPLWLAIQLKKNKKCQIEMPSWLDISMCRRSSFAFKTFKTPFYLYTH
jgi:hypothetical protein